MVQKKILACTIPQIHPEIYQGAENKKLFYGVEEATNNFVRSLIQYGTWDEYHVIDIYSGNSSLQLMWETTLGKSIQDCRIRLVNYFEFLRYLDRRAYNLLLEDCCFLQLSHLRALMGDIIPPISGHTHTISYNFMVHAFFTAMQNPLRPWDGIICTSRTAKSVIQKLSENIMNRSKQLDWVLHLEFPPQLEVIPFGVNLERFQPRSQKQARLLLNLPDDYFILLSLGRISKNEKMDIVPLIIAVRQIVVNHPNAKFMLLICGDDVYESHLDEIKDIVNRLSLHNNIRFTQNLKETEKPLYYNASDAFVSIADNVQETFGLTILEAMASGLPIIASDWDGYKDTVRHNETGYRIQTVWRPPSEEFAAYCNLLPWRINHLRLAQNLAVDLNQLIEKIVLLWKYPELCINMGKKSREYAVAEYDWKKIIIRCEKYWDELYEIYIRNNDEKKVFPSSITIRDYIAEFQDYPTRVLDINNRFSLTPMGSDFLEHPHLIHLLSGQKKISLFNESEIRRVLSYGKEQETFCIHGLLSDFNLGSEYEESKYYDIVMWLLKYNLLSLVSQ